MKPDELAVATERSAKAMEEFGNAIRPYAAELQRDEQAIRTACLEHCLKICGRGYRRTCLKQQGG